MDPVARQARHPAQTLMQCPSLHELLRNAQLRQTSRASQIAAYQGLCTCGNQRHAQLPPSQGPTRLKRQVTHGDVMGTTRDRHGDPVRIRARMVKALHAAYAAEFVHRSHCAELVNGELVCAFEKVKPSRGDNSVHVLLHVAY